MPARPGSTTASCRNGSSANEWIPAQAFAITCIALGDRGQTVKWLQKGAEDHTITLFELNNAPLYSEIKNYPEFPGLVRAAGGK
jgi:hypothetical protein